MIYATGIRSTILEALRGLLPEEPILPIQNRSPETWDFTEAPRDLRIVLAGGYLAGLDERSHDERTMAETYRLNFEVPMLIADQALSELEAVRICIVGSWSGAAGSFDPHYARAKSMIHRWAERQHVRAPRQLVCIAPPIIADSGMTRRRADFPGVLERRPHCFAIDVARAIKAALYELPPESTSNRVVFLPATAGPEPRTLQLPGAESPRILSA